MTVKGNPLMYLIAGGIVAVVAALLLSGPEDGLIPAPAPEPVALDDSDTPSEEVRAVGAGLTAIQTQIEGIAESQRALAKRMDEVERRAEILETVPASTPGEQPQAPEAGDQVDPPPLLPTGLGEQLEGPLDTIIGTGAGADDAGDAAAPGVQIRWVAPAATLPAPEAAEGAGLPSGLASTDIRAAARAAALGKTVRGSVPPGAMIDAWTLTALVGRVPVRGQVADAWPFKVVSGRGIASSWTALNLAGLIWEGVAYGDYTLRCVRGQLTRVTAIFADGSSAVFEGRQDSAESLASGLGWLTDGSGRPCLSGELITDAPRQIGRQALVGTIVGLARTIAENQRTRTVSPDGVGTSTLTGDATRAAVGDALSQAAQNIQTYLAARQADIWDAIYTPPNQAVTIHVAQEITFESDDHKAIFSAAGAADGGAADLD